MNQSISGQRFRQALLMAKRQQSLLAIVGTVNAYCALLAERAGFKAIYLSGAGVANISYGLPDLGMTTLEQVLGDVRRITQATSLPLLVDIDTGWEGDPGVEQAVSAVIQSGAAGVHIEDQVSRKRCGHRPNKMLVSSQVMCERLALAASNKSIYPNFYLIARTDAVADEGLEKGINRAKSYVEAGADAIFAEALLDIDQYKIFCDAVDVPVLANMTEFGKTPLYMESELYQAGVSMVLYPLTAVRAMNQAAMKVYQTLHQEGTQKGLLSIMQTREILYETLNYHLAEKQQDDQR